LKLNISQVDAARGQYSVESSRVEGKTSPCRWRNMLFYFMKTRRHRNHLGKKKGWKIRILKCRILKIYRILRTAGHRQGGKKKRQKISFRSLCSSAGLQQNPTDSTQRSTKIPTGILFDGISLFELLRKSLRKKNSMDVIKVPATAGFQNLTKKME